MPLFSVVIPTFNRAALIGATLASVRKQTFTDFEVLVVDDGSVDDTLKIAQRYPGVRLLKQNNRGPGAARNQGVSHSSSEYLAFLDSDDVWFPWTLATYASIIRQSQVVSFLTGKPFRFREEVGIPRDFSGDVEQESFRDYLASGAEWRWWGVSSFVIQRQVFVAAGGFEEANINGEDADLALKLGDAPGFVHILSPCTFGYREHGANASADLRKSLAGVWHKVRTEQAGGYPGGRARAWERWRILTRHIRPVTLACNRKGLRREAWALYRATLRWNIALGRWKYLAGFPLKLAS